MNTPDVPFRPAAVLWDMDGTLVDTEPYWWATESQLVERFGGTWTENDAESLIGFDLLDAAAVLRTRGRVELPDNEIVECLLDGVIDKLGEAIPWRPGARQLLEELGAAHIPCALVTMSWRRFADEILDALPADTFAAVITGDEVVRGKPHPDPYLEAASRLGVAANDCIAIEDSITGMRSAVAAGCRTIGVRNKVSLDGFSTDPAVTLWPSLVSRTVEDLVATTR